MSDNVFGKIDEMLAEIQSYTIDNADQLETFRIQYLGSKNVIKPIFGEIRNVPNEQKKDFGQKVNELKQAAEARFSTVQNELKKQSQNEAAADIDLTAPAYSGFTGGRHPIATTMRKVIDLLRSHTSSVQSRVMTSQKPPIRIIAPGRVYRNETVSARSHCQFHQVEGLYIDEKVSFADMKQTLLYFTREMYGADKEIRLRPSYFPFTEPDILRY